MNAFNRGIKLTFLAVIFLLNACSDPKYNNESENQSIKLWIAPNEAQENFWKTAVNLWNESNIGMPVNFTTIPATGSSEKAILTALVSGSAPDISTNIFSGFAAQLANLKQLQELSHMEGYQQLIDSRHMQRIMQDWDLAGNKYVLPLYSNPTLIWWRGDLLKKLGVHKAPETYQDVYELSEKYAASENKFGMQIIAGKNWEDRWFDFISYYYAASNGAPYIIENKTSYSNQSGRSVLKFIDKMFKNNWTGLDFDSDEPLVTGLVIGAVRGPWDIEYFKKMYPETLEKIVIGPMLTPEAQKGKASTFADSKGIVIFKHSKIKKEAFAFISWVLTHPKLNLLWLQTTGLPPARGDLTSNPVFKLFYEQHPFAKKYAEYVEVAVPPALIENTVDVQKVMNSEMIEPLIFGRKNIDSALIDASHRTNQLLRQ